MGGRGVYQVVLINALVSGTGDVGGGLGYSSAEDGQGLQQQGSCIRIPTARICWPEVGIHMGLISCPTLASWLVIQELESEAYLPTSQIPIDTLHDR